MKKLLLITGLIFLFIYSFFIEPNRLVVNTQDIFLPHLDKRLDGLKIGVVSDLHIGSFCVDLKRAENIVEKTNSYNPDLVFLLGDLDAKSVSRHYSDAEIVRVLNKFKSKYGVFSVLGNHDYNPPNIIRDIITASNVVLLENQSKYVNINGTTLKIVGFKDLWHCHIDTNEILGNYNNISTFVLTHNPDSFPDIPDFVSLTLCGHTHGGEVFIPLIGSFTVPSEYGDKYRKGYIVEKGKHLYVSGGVATLSHLRFCNPPEITILTVHPQTEETNIENKGLKKYIRKNYIDVIYNLFGH